MSGEVGSKIEKSSQPPPSTLLKMRNFKHKTQSKTTFIHQKHIEKRELLRTLSNIYDGTFLQKSNNFFHKKATS